MAITQGQAEEIARRYTAAWCARDPEAIASFHAADGAGITINDGTPWEGPAGVAEMARGFIDEVPDLVLTLDGIRTSGTYSVYLWTLEGTDSGPGGSGNPVKISGWEYWRLDEAGQVLASLGHYDAEDYARQKAGG